MLCLRVAALGEELGDGERGLCATVLGVLGLHLLPQLLGEGEGGLAVLARPLFAFRLFEAALNGARGLFLCLTAHDVGRFVYGGVVCPTVHDVRGVVGGCHVVIAEARERLPELAGCPPGL